MEFSLGDADDVKVKVEAPVVIAEDPRQLCARLVAIRVAQPAPTASSSSKEAAGPSGTAYRTQALRRIPSGRQGTRSGGPYANPPRSTACPQAQLK